MVLASGLVNLYDEDLGSNMESDTEVNVSNFLYNTSYKINSNQKVFVANQNSRRLNVMLL